MNPDSAIDEKTQAKPCVNRHFLKIFRLSPKPS